VDTVTDDSTLVGKEPCPKCHSNDNLARYADGHAHCFGATCKYWEPADDAKATTVDRSKHSVSFDPQTYTISALPNRGISEETCRIWNYGTGEFAGAALVA
jgi:twinkle protein